MHERKIRFLCWHTEQKTVCLLAHEASCAILVWPCDLTGRVLMVVTRAPQSASPDTVIPVIDLGPYLAGAPGALEATAAQLRNALETIGFFIIIHHDIPHDLIPR